MIVKQNFFKANTSFDKQKIYALITKAQEGNLKARNQLITDHIHLIEKMAWIYGKRSSLNKINDFIQEGVLGTMRGIEKFDIKRNVTFSTYIRPWIRAYIIKYIRRNASVVQNDSKDSRINNRPKDFYFGSPLFKNGTNNTGVRDTYSVEDYLMSTDDFNPEEYCIAKDLERKITKNLYKNLNNLERSILKDYIKNGKTYRQIGKECKMSHESIRIKLNKIYAKIKERVENTF